MSLSGDTCWSAGAAAKPRDGFTVTVLAGHLILGSFNLQIQALTVVCLLTWKSSHSIHDVLSGSDDSAEGFLMTSSAKDSITLLTAARPKVLEPRAMMVASKTEPALQPAVFGAPRWSQSAVRLQLNGVKLPVSSVCNK